MGISRIKKMIGEAVVRSDLPPKNKNVQWIDTINRTLKVYNKSTSNWEEVGESIAQTTKLGVKATEITPKRLEFPIEETEDFKRQRVEVLEFRTGGENQVQVISEFNNSDSTDFEENEYIIFDGKMNLKTSYPLAMTNQGNLGNGSLQSANIDLTNYDNIQVIEVL